MTYFEDLTPYTYFNPFVDEGPPGAVNIGWLDEDHSFARGETTIEFQEKLSQLCSNPMNVTRGVHRCPFCKGEDASQWGSAEIRVISDSQVYAAPSLIHHYVVAHRYCPPAEFIGAVLGQSHSD